MVDELPLFPLGHTVLFPGIVLPLHVFEERYRELVRDLVAQEDPGPRRFGVVAIRQGWEVGAEAAEALHGVGCAAELRRVSRYPDGRFDIVTVGSDRFRLLDVDRTSRPFLVGRVEWLPADPPPGAEAEVLARAVRLLFGEYASAATGLRSAQPGPSAPPPELSEDPGELSYLVASSAVLTLEDRQALLEAPTAPARLRAELRLLKRETMMVRRLRALPVPIAELQVTQSLS
ncbi:MAG: LON peptidase substrate-binding domain-containing protein [Mycobacteriales bacterium]